MGDVIDSNTATDDTLITLDRLEYILTKISENSMIWDVGLQMMVLKKLNCDASYDEVSVIYSNNYNRFITIVIKQYVINVINHIYINV